MPNLDHYLETMSLTNPHDWQDDHDCKDNCHCLDWREECDLTADDTENKSSIIL